MNTRSSKYLQVLVMGCLVTVCTISCKDQHKATEIVLKSLEAHGGIEKWKNAKELTYIKTTILYDSLGTIEKKITQTHKNRFKPKFLATIEWVEDTIRKKVILENGRTSVYFNDILQKDSKLQETLHRSMIAANYVIWQPFKLLDDDTTLSYIGKDIIDGNPVNVVTASYSNIDGSPANTWWYYFDQKTNKLVGNMVHHGSTYSFIKNTKYENRTGLFLNAERKSYMTDSLRSIRFLRADYTYQITGFKD
ncbi:hypothetical protein ACWGOQ_0000560 [Aquimarina sp. M1]